MLAEGEEQKEKREGGVGHLARGCRWGRLLAKLPAASSCGELHDGGERNKHEEQTPWVMGGRAPGDGWLSDS